ncbi:TetR/AcrR family transcriptional regulator [Phytoactinopolyspora limicola]|uniref:TetR/AcrR family transcriptional regulator n=1 Tax=Phytoactinopolyspora limicola TaxID=2715536 RepID=UPI00140A6C0C|nr:TetR family transcriptional regulator C-terminal domain-containing protein [Phytoactinopolyspora limicola]
MPKIVDHAARRLELVDACLRVVANAGLPGTTTREIAREAGVSHGIIAHYFDSKDEILRAALQRSYNLLAERIQAELTGLNGAAALRQALLAALPADDAGRTGEQIELALWGYALGNPAVADERWHTYAEWQRALEVLVRDAQVRGELDTTHDASRVAEAFVAMIDGLGVQTALYPERQDPQRQRDIIDMTLRAFGAAVPELDD